MATNRGKPMSVIHNGFASLPESFASLPERPIIIEFGGMPECFLHQSPNSDVPKVVKVAIERSNPRAP